MFGLGKKLGLFGKKHKIDEAFLEELEEILITSDISYDIADSLVKYVDKKKFKQEVSMEDVKALLKDRMAEIFTEAKLRDYSDFVPKIREFRASQLTAVEAEASVSAIGESKNAKPLPFVIMMIGVNGAGKTSTIGKMSDMLSDAGLTVSIAACDTFRTAAVEQIQSFAVSTGAHFIGKHTGADASGLAYESVLRAAKNNSDVLIIDTAGRLHAREELMAELAKMVRSVKKHGAALPCETFLVIDGTTGQNGLLQAENFGKEAGTTAIILTKMDSSARGGVVLSIVAKFGQNIAFSCDGETLKDINVFDSEKYLTELLDN